MSDGSILVALIAGIALAPKAIALKLSYYKSAYKGRGNTVTPAMCGPSTMAEQYR